MAEGIKTAFEDAQKQVSDFKAPGDLGKFTEIVNSVSGVASGNKSELKKLVLGEYVKKMKDPKSDASKQTKDLADFGEKIQSFKADLEKPFVKDMDEAKTSLTDINKDVDDKVLSPLSAPAKAVGGVKDKIDSTIKDTEKQCKNFQGIMDKQAKVLKYAGEQGKELMETVNTIMDKIKKFVEDLKDIKNAVMKPIDEMLSYIEKLKAPAKTFVDTLKSIVTKITNLKKEYQNETKGIDTSIDEIQKLKNTQGLTSTALDHGADKIESSWDTFDIEKLFKAFMDFFPKIKDMIVDGVKEMIEEIKKIFSDFVPKCEAVVEAVKKMGTTIQDKLKELGDSVDEIKEKAKSLSPGVPKVDAGGFFKNIFKCCRKPETPNVENELGDKPDLKEEAKVTQESGGQDDE